MNIREEVLAALIHLGANGPADGQYGICYEVHALIEKKYEGQKWDGDWDTDIDDFLEELMLKWPKHSGSRNYPVPAPSKYTPPGTFFWATMQNGRKWDGKTEYGQLRWELLQFCITTLSQGE